MGQKVNPKIFRMGITMHWPSKWFSTVDYAKNLKEDVQIRKLLRTKLKEAGLALIEIERFVGKIDVNLHAAKPGLIIGKGGKAVEDLKKEVIKKVLSNEKILLNINIQEVSKPNLSSEIVLQNMAGEIERRMPYRRVMKRAMDLVRKAGAQGVKVQVAGRLNGAEIARTEILSDGKIPLHTMRADIDYARGVARTTYGVIGIKVWIYKGEIFKKNNK